MRGQAGFWDVDERYALLSKAGDPLEKLNAVVAFELFRQPLAKALKRSDGAKGGRPPYDAVMMFKILVLQALYSLGDDQAEFQIRDRLSFMRFLGLGLGDDVPDAKTIWVFREQLVQVRAVEKLFARFDKHLAKAGYLAMGGQIVDATVVAAPKQRNTDAEKADGHDRTMAGAITPANKAAGYDCKSTSPPSWARGNIGSGPIRHREYRSQMLVSMAWTEQS
jgi:transposase